MGTANLVLSQPLWIFIRIPVKQEADGCHVEERITQEFESLIARDLLLGERVGRVYEGRP